MSFQWRRPFPVRSAHAERALAKRPSRKRRFRQSRIEFLEPRLPLAAEVEPNNSPATATVIGTATEYHTGSLPSILDVDYFQIPLTQGQRLTANYGQPGTFDPELIGGLEILDSAGRVLSRKQLNNAAQAIAPRDGTYYVRTVAANEYGAFNGNYTLQTSVTAFSGATESEPNDTFGTADSTSTNIPFRGTLTTAGDLDYYSFFVTGTNPQVVSIDFVSVPSDSPTVIVYRPDGTELGRGNTGLGVQLALPVTGQYRFAISSARSDGTFTGQYVGHLAVANPAVEIPATATSFDTATVVTLGASAVTTVGTLTSLDTARYFSFDVTTLNQSSFYFQSLPQNVLLSLYNERGTVLNRFGSSIDTSSVDFGFTTGRYYVSLQALTEAGLGPFQVIVQRSSALSAQRDVPLYFADLTMQQSTHLGRAWVAPFSNLAASDLLQGLFESRYDAWDVDYTQTMPAAGTEYVSAGFGDFGDIGAGGYGSGGYGNRRPSGDSVIDARSTWTSFGYGRSLTLIHETGHATGLSHARSVQGVMGYVNDDEILPVGSSYLFPWTDSFVPSNYQNNPRDYLDWALQAGRHFIESEPNDTPGTTISLNSYLGEMQSEFQNSVSGTTGAGTNPFDLKLANLNGDAWPDLVVANNTTETISVHLGTGVGQFAAGVSYSPGLISGLDWFYNILATGDLNQDGRDDVIVGGGSTSNNIAIYLANVDGTLGTPTISSHPTQPYRLALADLNNDMRLDLIIGSTASTVSVQLGNENGTFQTRANYTTGGTSIRDLIVARIDSDMQLDVLTVSNANDNVSVLRGNANGTLQAAVNYAMGDGPMSAALVDVTNDGIVDLVTINGNSSDFSIRPGTGTGTFGAQTTQPAISGMYSLSTGDFNGDFRRDLVVSSSQGARIFAANAAGTLTEFMTLQNTLQRASVVADLNADGRDDLVWSNYYNTRADVLLSKPNDVRNDRVVALGRIDSASDVDRYSFTAAAGQRFSFDVEAAEFQYPLDAVLSIFDGGGNLLAQNDDALDRDTGLTSVDPYLVHTFADAGTYVIQVASKANTAGNYRFKLTPEAAWDDDGPRVLGTLPTASNSVKARRQVFFFVNDQLDPATLTAANIRVQGNSSGVRSGTVTFDPFESVLIWTADSVLPVDVYTVTLVGAAGGIADLKGNLLDGETDGSFAFPEVSGNQSPGGDFSFQFTINIPDTAAAGLNSASYFRNPYNRGEFNLFYNDELSVSSVASAQLVARGSGPDGLFNTADDRVLPLDVLQDNINHRSTILAYTRGIPDPDRYRIEGTVLDSAGLTVNINTIVNVAVEVPESALFTDVALTQNGVVGSYVNSSLRSYAPQDDWRTTQAIVGTRTDADLNFPSGGFGMRASVGVTGGASDTNWDQFSVQWDGYIRVPSDGTRLLLRSTNGSRAWIDLNNDGTFGTSGSEFVSNFWGTTGSTTGTLSTSLPAGTYRIRVQYEHATGSGEQLILEWMTPDVAGWENGIGHGPSVIDTSIQPGSSLNAANVNRFDVVFSGAVNPATLTPANFRIRYSPDPRFFNGNELFLTDSDGVIAWNAAEHRATFQTATPFAAGYYLVELNGDAGGIAANNGQLLDGEYLDSFIAGNVLSMQWQDAPSGDGVAGGDYLAAFTVTNFAASVAVGANVNEDGAANLVYTFSRTGDVSLAATVDFTVSGTANFSSDYSQTGAASFSAAAGTVTFAAGAATAVVQINPTTDVDFEIDETVVLTISPGATYNVGVAFAASGTISNDDLPSLQVIGFSPTFTGAVFQVNRDLDVSGLNLYDSSGGTWGAADLTLVGQATGNVRGSLVVAPNNRQVTFITTAGRLPADHYTLTLRSGADAFRDANGSLLDGDADGNPGGYFVRTFDVVTLPANAVSLSLPNIVRGPAQPVHLPTDVTAGIPISFSNGGGITSASFELRYDPLLLEISAATVAPGIAGGSVTFTSSTPGLAQIQFNSQTPLPAGTTRFVDLTANVPSTATYRSKHLLDLGNIVLNGGAIPAVDDDALHVVAFLGDVTGNGSYNSLDVSTVMRLAVALENGIATYRLLDPRIIADINSDGEFTGGDSAALQRAAVAFGSPEIPLPLPSGTLLSGGPDPKVSIPADLIADPGESLAIPVLIDSIVDLTGNGLLSADLVLYYDPIVLDVRRVTLGNLLFGKEGWNLFSRIDPLAGRIYVSLAGTRPLDGIFQGELVQLQATINPRAPAGRSPINLAAGSLDPGRQTLLNEGSLTLIPAPTNSAFDPGVDGLVTIRRSGTLTSEAPLATIHEDRLLVSGTSQADQILISPAGKDQIIVRVNDVALGRFAKPREILVLGQEPEDRVYLRSELQPLLSTMPATEELALLAWLADWTAAQAETNPGVRNVFRRR